MAWFRQYWNESRRPLVCILFVLPFLVVYELGSSMAPNAARNGAEVWMRGGLNALGLDTPWMLPIIVLGVLLAWHHLAHHPWRCSLLVLLGMAVESALLAVLLRAMASLYLWRLSLMSDARYVIRRLVEYAGAGLYEETLFRLVLLSVLLAVFTQAMQRKRALVMAAVVSSIAFALAHHLGTHGEPFAIGRFLFRTAAGGLFALIFLYRGFGVAVGAHALYDILVGLGR